MRHKLCALMKEVERYFLPWFTISPTPCLTSASPELWPWLPTWSQPGLSQDCASPCSPHPRGPLPQGCTKTATARPPVGVRLEWIFSLGVRFCGHRTLLLDRGAASWGGINKQTVYLYISCKTNLNIVCVSDSIFSIQPHQGQCSQAWVIRESS